MSNIVEHIDPNIYDDDGTMPENVEAFADEIVGHRIVSVDYTKGVTTAFTLDTGKRVILQDTNDCCAFTEMQDVIPHLDKIDHIITKVVTGEGYSKWHLFADLGEVLELQVGWSEGNPYYYGYGFDIRVVDDE